MKFLVGFFVAIAVASDNLDTWLAQQEVVAVSRILDNVSHSGTLRGSVIASPSRGDPTDYFYVWTRDAALTAKAILQLRTSGILDSESVTKMMWEYAEFSQVTQVQGLLGEPKFHVDGSEVVSFFKD